MHAFNGNATRFLEAWECKLSLVYSFKTKSNTANISIFVDK